MIAQAGPSRESGAALLVTLILIALMALLAFSGSEATRLQQRLASNDLAAQIAFQAAEAALREGIAELDNAAPYLTGFCAGSGANYEIEIDDLANDDGYKRLESGTVIDFKLGDVSGITISKPPRYLIACIEKPDNATPPTNFYFRVYAQGYGPRGEITRTLEARYVPE